MIEQRLTVRLLKYWDLIRKNNPFPDIAHFNPASVDDLWPNCFRISIGQDKNRLYKYEYMGDPIKQAYGVDLTGSFLDERIKQFPHIIVSKKLADVIHEQRPLEDAGYFVNDKGKLVKYRACFLPFGNEQKGLTHIIVGFSYRIA